MILRRIIVFGYPLLEVLLLWWVASLIGWGFALLLVIAGFPAGAALIRNAAAKATYLSTASETEKPALTRSTTGMFLAGLLIMIPGFATDFLGCLVLLPPVQKWIVRKMGSWIQHRMVRVPGFAAYTSEGDVIQGFVITEEGTGQKSEGPEGPSPQINR